MVTIVLTRYESAKILPAFAACLAKLPNLTTIQGTVVPFSTCDALPHDLSFGQSYTHIPK